MNTQEKMAQENVAINQPGVLIKIQKNVFNMRLFPRLILLVLIGALLSVIYLAIFASDRYVSEASIIIRKTDSVSVPSIDIGMVIAGVAGVNRADQLLLREYLLSIDMLKKLDAKLQLKAHYSDSAHDLISRMWLDDIEWFHRHYLSRVTIEYDDFVGVLRLKAQAYTPEMALAISRTLVEEGEGYMNQLGHEMADAQVSFLESQVNLAQKRHQEASQVLLAYQNKKSLFSPQATAESLGALVGKLEEKRAQIQTQLAALPRNLDRDHPNLLMLQQSLAAIDRQIAQENAKLANPSGKTLNTTMEEFQRLQLEVSFTQDIYKAALTALEKGRIDATRMLEKVSVLQAPSLPEYPMEPRRLYLISMILVLSIMVFGILKMLEAIVLDHVD